jgi:hypothetical protein
MNLRSLQKFSINKEFYDKFYVETIRQKDEKQDRNEQSKMNYNKKQTHNKNVISGGSSLTAAAAAASFPSLFWTLYSLLNEHEVILQQNKFKLRSAFALTMVERLKTEKVFLKQHKLKFHDIESNLLYEKDISLATLKCIVLLNKLNLIYVWNNKYYVFESNDDDPYYVIQRNRETFSFRSELDKQAAQDQTKGKLQMEDIRTSIKSLSSYKLDDLKKMADVLAIEHTQEKKTKQQLYEEIVAKID